MTEINIDLGVLVREICKALDNTWSVVQSEIKHVVTIQHQKRKAQIRFRFIMSGSNEGQLKIFGRLCDDLEQYNPIYNDIFPSGDTKVKMFINPQRTPAAIAKDMQKRLLPKLWEVVTKAEDAYVKANSAKLRKLGEEELLISASYNQLMRVPQNSDLTYYNRKRGRSVTVGVQDPASVAGNVRIILDVDSYEAEIVLCELFSYWQSLAYPDEVKYTRNVKR